MIYNIPEGSSNELRFQLLESGIPIDLRAVTVDLFLWDANGTQFYAIGAITVADPVNGKVIFTPSSITLFVAAQGPYEARWMLTDSFGRTAFVPTVDRDIWSISGTFHQGIIIIP